MFSTGLGILTKTGAADIPFVRNGGCQGGESAAQRLVADDGGAEGGGTQAEPPAWISALPLFPVRAGSQRSQRAADTAATGFLA